MTKIIVLNQSTWHFEYNAIDALAKSTWARVKHPDVTVIHYYGGYDLEDKPYSHLSGTPAKGSAIMYDNHGNNILVCGVQDVVSNPLTDPRNQKLIIAYEWCLNNLEFDYIVRICNTTYLDIKKMHKFLDSLERKDKQYDGARNMYNNEYYFCGGSFNYLSKDCVQQLVNNKEEYLSLPYPLSMEDLGVGVILFNKLNYAVWDEVHQDVKTSATSLGDNGGPLVDYVDDIIANEKYFAYRFRISSTEEYIQFHNKVLRKYV
jgi:hypothetical protein